MYKGKKVENSDPPSPNPHSQPSDFGSTPSSPVISTVRSIYYTVTFFFDSAHSICKSHMYNKTDSKANTLYLSLLSSRAAVPPVSPSVQSDFYRS